jgi:hypothetical protein
MYSVDEKDRNKKPCLTNMAALRLVIFVMLVINCSPIAFGQWVEDFGHICSVSNLKGQVRDGLDEPIPHANIQITSLNTGKTYSIEADEKWLLQEGRPTVRQI